MNLLELNTDCLLQIFRFCSESDLRNLSIASQALNEIINDNIFYIQTLDMLICGHRNSPIIQKRTHIPLSYGDRLIVGNNWINGYYRDLSFFHHRQMFSTKLHLEKDYLYITHAAYLRKFRRTRNEVLQRLSDLEISTSSKSNIARFVKKRDIIFAGRVDGSCFVYEDGDITEQRMHPAKEYLYCVDFENSLYATSSGKCTKLWQRAEEFGIVHFDLGMELKSAFKSMKLSSGAQWLFGGLYTDESRRALRAIDVASGVETILNSDTSGIYDLTIKDEHVILTANFEFTLRMYDRRSDVDVAIWEDSFDSPLYCLEYDGLYAVLCGTMYESRVNLYDIRVPGKTVRSYFVNRSRLVSCNPISPVCSIACDNQFLFVATNHNLRVLDFNNGY